jgi:hypothetical protein
MRLIVFSLGLSLFTANAFALPLRVNASQDDGIVPAIHGTTNGPLVRRRWNPPCANHFNADWSAQYRESKIPSVRMHGGGAMDMNKIWRPWPNYPENAASDPANYDWQFLDEAIAAHSQVSAPFLRFGPSGNHGISDGNGGGCDPSRPTATPPENFAVYGQVALHILKHLKEGWGCLDENNNAVECANRYDVRMAEVWNEFYISDFWNGDGIQAAQLYEAISQAVHPVFPDFMLGPSINFPNGPRWQLPRDFWCYAQTNNLRIDFIAPHFYRPTPNLMNNRVHGDGQPARPQTVELCAGAEAVPRPENHWEAYLEAYGYAGMPIVNAEWNRDGNGVSCYNNGQRGDTIPAGAYVAGSLISLAEMHPENSDHNVILSHLFSSRSQLFQGDGYKAPGIGLMAYGKYLFGETPVRLACSGGWDDNDHDMDLKLMAGRSHDRRRVNLLISSYDTSTATQCPTEVGANIPVDLRIENLPWGAGAFTWERWRHTEKHRFERVGSGNGQNASFTSDEPLQLNALELYRLEFRGDIPDAGPGDSGQSADIGSLNLDAGAGAPAADSGPEVIAPTPARGCGSCSAVDPLSLTGILVLGLLARRRRLNESQPSKTA